MDSAVQGYLAHKKPPPPRTLQKDYAQGHTVDLGGVAVSYERGSHTRDEWMVPCRCQRQLE